MSLTSAPEYMRYIRASAGRAGLNVVWEEINQPRHDGKTIFLPCITKDTSEKSLVQLRASVDHEVAHDKFSDFSILKRKKSLLDKYPELMFVWNFLEDSRINTLEAHEFKGFREVWDSTTGDLLVDMAKNLKEDKRENSPNRLIEGLVYWESELNKDLFPNVEMVVKDHFYPSSKIIEYLGKFKKDLLKSHTIESKVVGSKCTFDLAKSILQIEDDSPEDKEEDPSKSEEEKEGQESSDKAEMGEEGEKAPKDDKYKIVRIKVKKEDFDKVYLTIPKTEEKMRKVGINFDVTEDLLRGGDSWTLTDLDKFEVIDYPSKNIPRKFGAVRESSGGAFRSNYEVQVGEKFISEEGFAQQVRRLIQIRAKVQRQYGVKKGKLDQSRLSRICFNAPGLNERVFKNKITNSTLDAAITVLVDMSGSMSGTKLYNALGSAVLMNEVCSTLNIPIELLGFSDTYTVDSHEAVPLMFIFKGFNNLKVSSDDLKNYIGHGSSFMLGNPDGENILWAYDRLVKRREKNRILIVMSDGNPAAAKSGGDIIPFTAKVIKNIENEGKVFIYGLGLCSSAVTHFYKYNSVVNRPEQIPHKLLELFEQRIIKND